MPPKKKITEEQEDGETMVEETVVADEPLIIRCLANGSRRLLLTPTLVNDVTKETIPGLDLFFESELKMMWNSKGQKYPPTWLRYWGSPEAVIAAIKQGMDEQMKLQPMTFEYLTEAQYQAILAEESRKDILEGALAHATAHPEDQDAQEYLELAKKLAAKARTTVVRGAVRSE